MAVEVRDMIPVQPRGGGLVHITSLFGAPGRTACGRPCPAWTIAPLAQGWEIAPIGKSRITCRKCKAAIYFRVDPEAKARAR
jgi:hypothetical protein